MATLASAAIRIDLRYALKEAREIIRMFKERVGEAPTVLEIGCNDGMHTKIFLEEMPGIKIHCFEPDPRPVPRFEALVGNDPRVSFYPLAICAQTGPVPWYASGGTTSQSWMDDWDLSGSIRKPTGHLRVSPWVTFTPTGKIPGMALDDWVAQYLEPNTVIDLVFADVQGAEADLLDGGKNTFRDRVKFLYTEYSDRQLYDGQPNLQQIMKRLPKYKLVRQFKQDVFLQNTALSSPGQNLSVPGQTLSGPQETKPGNRSNWAIELAKFGKQLTGATTFVEGGTRHGNTTTKAADIFQTVYTVEIEAAVSQQAQKQHPKPNINWLVGDSPALLAEVILPRMSRDKPAVFWLDAHCSNPTLLPPDGHECPLLAELELIFAHSREHFLMIDDARLFIAPPKRLHRRGHWPDLTEVMEAIQPGKRPSLATRNTRFV